MCVRVLGKNQPKFTATLNNSLSERDMAVAKIRGYLIFFGFENFQFIEAGSIKHASKQEQFRVQFLLQIRVTMFVSSIVHQQFVIFEWWQARMERKDGGPGYNLLI